MVIKPQKIEIELKSYEDLAERTRNFVFSIPAKFDFQPGQFLTLTLKTESGEDVNRSYSIASTPKKGELQFCIKELHELGGSGAVFDLKVGDKIPAMGPFGRFILKSNDLDKVFITVGTGIAPFRAMIPKALEKNKVQLIAGFRKEKNALYHYDWKVLEKNNKNFEYLEIISRPEKKDTKPVGRVQNILEELFKEDPEEMKKKDFYMCGMGEMVKSTREFLEKQGVSKEQINFERYS